MTFNKVYYGIWAVLFALFAFWQFNDPDPEIWVSIYAVAIIFCLLGFKGIFPKIPLTIVVVACLVGAAFYWQGDVGGWVSQEVKQHDLSMKNDFMEESRESFGLLIIALVMVPGLVKAWGK